MEKRVYDLEQRVQELEDNLALLTKHLHLEIVTETKIKEVGELGFRVKKGKKNEKD